MYIIFTIQQATHTHVETHNISWSSQPQSSWMVAQLRSSLPAFPSQQAVSFLLRHRPPFLSDAEADLPPPSAAPHCGLLSLVAPSSCTKWSLVYLHTLHNAHQCKHNILSFSIMPFCRDTSTAHTSTQRQQQPLHQGRWNRPGRPCNCRTNVCFHSPCTLTRSSSLFTLMK